MRPVPLLVGLILGARYVVPPYLDEVPLARVAAAANFVNAGSFSGPTICANSILIAKQWSSAIGSSQSSLPVKAALASGSHLRLLCHVAIGAWVTA